MRSRSSLPTPRDLAAQNIPADVLIELVSSGLAVARNQLIDDDDGAVEVTLVWITAAGERVLAARGQVPVLARF